MKEKLVAIKYDELGKCEQVAIVKNVQDKDYKALKNEESEHLQELLKNREETVLKLKTLERENDNKDLWIAWSIYSTFIMFGYIEEENNFNSMLYEHIMEGKELDLSKMPSEFETILNYVRGI